MEDSSAVHLLVAKAQINGQPEIQLLESGPVRLKRGQRLHVKYVYRVEESSLSKEAWTFVLRSNVGRVERGPQKSTWTDRFALRDDLWGEICQEYAFDEPGEYQGAFDVRAEYAQGRWTQGAPAPTGARAASGKVRVVVE